MANPELAKVVNQGAGGAAFRRWRAQHPDEVLDLAGAYLGRGAQLGEARS